MMRNPIRQFVVWTVALVLALPGILLAGMTLVCLVIVLPALWTGVLERPDFLGGMENVRIVRTADPSWFWSNVEFYGFVSVVLGAITPVLFLPLAFRIAAVFRRIKGATPHFKRDQPLS